PPPTDRRRAVRFQPAFGTICRFRDAGPDAGLVWDLSATGVGMLLADPPPPGTILAAELTTERATLPISLRAVHVRPVATGDYFLGAQFVRPLTPEEVRPFVTPVPGNPFPRGND